LKLLKNYEVWRKVKMTGYEDLTPSQIIYLMHLVVLTCFLILVTKIVPAILQYRSMKFLEVKIMTKQCEENKVLTLFRKVGNWVKERKNKEHDYQSRYSNVKRMM